MKKLSVNSKRGQRFVKAYNKSTWHTLKDVYPARQGIPTEVLENRILETFNSFEGTKSDPFISVKIMRKQKPLRAK